MNYQSLPTRIARRVMAPVVRTGSVVFFERELAVPVPRAQIPQGFQVRFGKVEDLPLLVLGLTGRTEAQLRERFDRGDLCALVLDDKGAVAHASWIAFSSAWIPELQMMLTVYPGEAYGYDFFTRADLRGKGAFAAVRQFICDELRAKGLERFFIYVAGENRSGLAGAATWQKQMGRLRYLRLRGTSGAVWGSCPFTLSRKGEPVAPARVPVVNAEKNSSLRVEVVSDAASLIAFGPTWNELVERAGMDHPFLSHEWVVAFWEAFGGGRDLRVLTVYAGDKCIAIAPLMLERTRFYGIPVRSLDLIGNEHTPRSGFIVAERAEEACSTLLEAMNKLSERWAMAVLPQLADGTATLIEMEKLARGAGIHTGIWHGQASPRLELHAHGHTDWESYLKSLKPKQRTNLRNRLNRLKRLGEVEFEEITGGPELHLALEDGLRIEAAAWKGANSTAMDSCPESSRFYRRFAEAAAQRGWLCLDFLKVGGKRIAFSYGLRFHNIRYLIKQGYDPEFGAASPSQVLIAFMLEKAFERGVTAFDFLGADEPWKREWTAEARAHSWLYLFQPGLATWPLHFAKFRLLPAVRERWLAAS